jgi:hypothetical protein
MKTAIGHQRRLQLRRAMKARCRRQTQKIYMVVVHHPLVGSGEVTPEQARSCYEHLSTSAPVRLEQQAVGQRSRCFTNVEKHVRRHGGESVMGWIVAGRCPGPNRNRLAASEAIAHAVWRSPEGQLIELTPGHAQDEFFPDPSTPQAACTIYFVDSFDLAKRWHSRQPELLRVLWVAAGTDHVVDRGVLQFCPPLTGSPPWVQVGRSLSAWLEEPLMIVPAGCSPSHYQDILLGVPETKS